MGSRDPEYGEKFDVLELSEIEDLIGVMPPHIDQRIINQEAVFTMHPNPAIPLDNDNITKYVFPGSIKDKASSIIRRLGIKHSRICPGIDGISKDIAEELMPYVEGYA